MRPHINQTQILLILCVTCFSISLISNNFIISDKKYPYLICYFKFSLRVLPPHSVCVIML